MGTPLERTLGQLRVDLQSRTGFANVGSPSALQRAVFNSMLWEAQWEVYYDMHGDQLPQVDQPFPFISGQSLYDWPDTVNPRKTVVIRVSIDTAGAPCVVSLERKLTNAMRSNDESESWPSHWQMEGGQIRVWPRPDQDYDGTIVNTPWPNDFTQDDDRASVPSVLLFKLALYKAKLHYGRPDAEESALSYERIKNRMLAGANAGERIVRNPRRGRQRTPHDGSVPPRRL